MRTMNEKRTMQLLAVSAAAMLVAASGAAADVAVYTAFLDGPSESPPVPSPATGSVTVTFDTAAHTMRVEASWSGLLGTTTVAHIHAPTAMAFAGTVGVATYPGTFPGFPAGVTAGSYDMTIDMSLASSYTPAFIGLFGGSPAAAELGLIDFINQGRAYFNIHSTSFPGGEIRGFLVPAPGAAAMLGLAGVCAIRRRRA